MKMTGSEAVMFKNVWRFGLLSDTIILIPNGVGPHYDCVRRIAAFPLS